MGLRKEANTEIKTLNGTTFYVKETMDEIEKMVRDTVFIKVFEVEDETWYIITLVTRILPGLAGRGIATPPPLTF